jgi:two-component system response regulator HydG
VLVVDDQRNMRATTAMLLRAEGHVVLEAGDAEEALGLLSQEPVDLLLTDMRMEPLSGLELTRRALEISPQLQVIVMTAFGSIESAVEAMRLGAYDYLTKPFKEGELVHRVQRALERANLLSAVNLFAKDFHSRHGLVALVGQSQVMRELTARILRVAPSDATVLIQGESGTGKELVARAVHAYSRRNERPFVPVNCAAISEGLLESELFGHTKGAFTGATRSRRGLFEEADGGTLFIDEVTETTPAFQSKLLRVLQNGEVRRVGESTAIKVDVRTVAASNRNLEKELSEGRFRQDLFYRLNVVTLRVPPLRERPEDIPLLAEHFLARINARSQIRRRLSASALERLMAYPFPGNVRELENLVEQAAALAEGEELTPDDFPVRAGGEKPNDARPSPEPGGEDAPELLALADAVAEAERKAIESALARYPNDLQRVAVVLNISATTLWRKMKRLGIGAGSRHPEDPSDPREVR